MIILFREISLCRNTEGLQKRVSATATTTTPTAPTPLSDCNEQKLEKTWNANVTKIFRSDTFFYSLGSTNFNYVFANNLEFGLKINQIGTHQLMIQLVSEFWIKAAQTFLYWIPDSYHTSLKKTKLKRQPVFELKSFRFESRMYRVRSNTLNVILESGFPSSWADITKIWNLVIRWCLGLDISTLYSPEIG